MVLTFQLVNKNNCQAFICLLNVNAGWIFPTDTRNEFSYYQLIQYCQIEVRQT